MYVTLMHGWFIDGRSRSSLSHDRRMVSIDPAYDSFLYGGRMVSIDPAYDSFLYGCALAYYVINHHMRMWIFMSLYRRGKNT